MKLLNSSEFKKALISASNNLFNNKERIDALNVFPVPDGDTGSNMSSTFSKACDSLEGNSYKTVSEIIVAFAKNLLLSARGNSGVILSQIFKGFSIAWAKSKELDAEDIVKGFEQATKTAYASVLKPIEGTILTVIRETAENLRKNFKTTMNVKDVFKKAVGFAKKSVTNTPNILPVLKEVGVVDSGGEGLLMVIEGLYSSLEGNQIEIDLEKTRQLDFISNTEIYTGEFGYCTELILEISDVSKFGKDHFVKQIEKLGNSLVAVQDKEILKIHIHSLTPGKVLNLSQKYGEFLTVKVENMTQQANNTKSNAENTQQENKIEKQQKKKENAIISCNSGTGFSEMMKEYECDYIIENNNPSIEDIVEAINIVNADNIIILPNNSNVILAAQQAAKINNKKNIHIVPTKNQVEGISAILNYSSDLPMKDNLYEINQTLKNMVVGEISKSVKNTTIDGVKVKKDEYLMIMKNKIIGSKKDMVTSAQKLVDNMIRIKKNPEVLVIYYGNDASNMDAKKLEKYIISKYDVEVEIYQGGQHTYDLLLGLE